MKKWRKYNGALVPLTPPHVEVDVHAIKEKVKRENVFFARWTSDFDCDTETQFWYVINDNSMEIGDYSRNTRSKIRRGLKNCEVRLVNIDEIIQFGFDSYSAAFTKYNTHLRPKSEVTFKKELTELVGDWEFWGIYNNSIMIGYCQNKVIGDYCDYSTIKFHPDYLNLYPSYALFYSMNQFYLNERKFKYINDGVRSISHDTNIQSFLIDKFKFRKAFCKLNISYHPLIRYLVLVLYPFYSVIRLLRFGPFLKLDILLFQEKIRRSYER